MNADIITRLQLTDAQAAFCYLGQEGILIRYQNRYLVIDPYLTDYVDRNCCIDSVCWKRLYPAPFTPEEMDFVDYILLTHEHYDHADPDTLRRIRNCNDKVRFVAPSSVIDALLSYGIPQERIICAVADQPLHLDSFTVIPVAAAHEELHPVEKQQYRELSYRISFGGYQVFHGGDCCLYPGLEEKVLNMDVMFLPVNGRSFYRLQDDIIGNMTAEEAVIFAKRTNAGLFVPLHYDLYEINRVTPVHIVDTISRISPKQRFHLFQPGEHYLLTK